ncbi:hypothetical protein [Prochlorococcus sp. MIT 1303]|uniref:hypothetical protein n=1 Tax=Prochlorococcus sp. MIT 1303 TaxID=1723647 RepID=UPI0012E87945|nr:hypothetical protein [Prochlorococcus sp. MIT 1303]
MAPCFMLALERGVAIATACNNCDTSSNTSKSMTSITTPSIQQKHPQQAESDLKMPWVMTGCRDPYIDDN